MNDVLFYLAQLIISIAGRGISLAAANNKFVAPSASKPLVLALVDYYNDYLANGHAVNYVDILNKHLTPDMPEYAQFREINKTVRRVRAGVEQYAITELIIKNMRRTPSRQLVAAENRIFTRAENAGFYDL